MVTMQEKLDELDEKRKRQAVINWILQEIDQHLLGHGLTTSGGVEVEDEVINSVYGDIMENFVGPLEQEIEDLLSAEV